MGSESSGSTLSLIIKAVDKATGPLRAISQQLEHVTAPIRKIGHDLKQFGEVSGLMKVGEAFKGVGEAAHKVTEKAWELGKELALMTIEAGFVLFEFVKHFVEMGDELKKTSDRLGLTVDGFASLQFAARKAGISSEDFTGALDKFNKELGLAHHGTGKLFKFLEGASPVLLKQVTAAKSTEEALDLMWRAMAKFEKPADRAAFATAIFGKQAVKMGALVKDGTAGLAEQREEFFRLAGSQTWFAGHAEELNDMLIDVSTAFSGLGASIAVELFPALMELGRALREFLVENKDGVARWAKETGQAITDWVRGGGIQRLIDGFKDLVAKVQPIVDMLGGWPRVLAGIAVVIVAGPLLGALAGLAASFVTLGVAMLTTPFGWFLAAAAGIAAIALVLYKNWGAVSEFFKEFFPGFSADVSRAVDGLAVLVGWTAKLIGYLREQKELRENMAEINKGAPTAGSLNEKASNVLQTGFELGMASIPGANALRALVPGVNDARPPRGGNDGKAAVTVDFTNAPKGTRAKVDPGSTADVDLSMGYTMVGG